MGFNREGTYDQWSQDDPIAPQPFCQELRLRENFQPPRSALPFYAILRAPTPALSRSHAPVDPFPAGVLAGLSHKVIGASLALTSGVAVLFVGGGASLLEGVTEPAPDFGPIALMSSLQAQTS